jgi:hypothetical protein
MAITDDIEHDRQEADRHRENAGRLAQVHAVFTSTGQGTTQYAKRVDFGLTFIEKPIVSYGCSVDMNAIEDLVGTDADLDVDGDTPLPLATGYVTEWDLDERNFYLGCWIAASVMFSPYSGIATDAQPVLEHNFLFSGIGIKDIPPELT